MGLGGKLWKGRFIPSLFVAVSYLILELFLHSTGRMTLELKQVGTLKSCNLLFL